MNRSEGTGGANGKRTGSARKIEANRRNARKSTGPKTATGKKRVSRNAIKHGVLFQMAVGPAPGW